MLKGAVIGVGTMGKHHARILHQMDTVDLVALCDTNSHHLETCKKFCENRFSDYKIMIQKCKPDFVCLAVPVKSHTKLAVDILNLGVHLLIEKPIADTVENADFIIKAAEKNKVKLMVGQIERFNPVIQRLKAELLANKLGAIYSVEMNRLCKFPHRNLQVGVAMDLAVHEIDIFKYLFEEKFVKILAKTQEKIRSPFDDSLSAILQSENGILCKLNVNWLGARKKAYLKIVGENGIFVADYIERTLAFCEKKSGKITHYEIKSYDMLKMEISAFTESILHDSQPPISGNDGKYAVEIALKILESSKKQKVLNLDKNLTDSKIILSHL